MLGHRVLSAVLAVWLSQVASAEELLIIESYHADYPWDQSYKEGIHSVIGDRYPLVNFEMDTKRLPKSAYAERAEAAWAYYQAVQPKLVFLGDDNALRLLGPRFAKTTTPVVYLGINNNPRHYGIQDAKNITGVLERPRLSDAIFLIERLIASEDLNVLVLLDSGVTSQVVQSEVFDGKNEKQISHGHVSLKRIDSWETWQSEVLQAKQNGYQAIIPGLFHTLTDATGRHIDSEVVIRWTSQHTPVPPFAFWDFAVGDDKTIGGIVLHGKQQGITAGKIALQILQGTPPATIYPQTGEKGTFLFNRLQLKKWNLDQHPFILGHSEHLQ